MHLRKVGAFSFEWNPVWERQRSEVHHTNERERESKRIYTQSKKIQRKPIRDNYKSLKLPIAGAFIAFHYSSAANCQEYIYHPTDRAIFELDLKIKSTHNKWPFGKIDRYIIPYDGFSFLLLHLLLLLSFLQRLFVFFF